MLVIGCYEASFSDLPDPVITLFLRMVITIFDVMQSLELWDIREKNTMTFNNAHDGMIAALAASSATGKVASVSHDKFVKLWK